MDNETARFILRSFRPDGADANDPDFAEALKLAVENRELGEWLASERAFDAGFSDSLNSVSLPADLREDILSYLAAERGDFPQVDGLNDAAWVGALASIKAPDSLRNEVLMAMKRTAQEVPRKFSIFRRLLIPLAIAAGIMLALFIIDPARPTVVAGGPALPVEALQVGFHQAYKSPFFRLDEKSEIQATLIHHLQQQGLPYPIAMPPGLQKLKSFGCRELVIGGKQGSLICFETADNGVIHLLIFRREDVIGDLPAVEKPTLSQEGKWGYARWGNQGNACFVISEMKPDLLATLF
jgi:hypothetical protein